MKTRLLLVLAASFAVVTPAAAQKSLTKVRVAYDGFSMTSGPLIYADKQGIFKKFGLDIAPVFIDGGSMLTQAVVGGSVDIAQNGYTPALSAAVQGADFYLLCHDDVALDPTAVRVMMEEAYRSNAAIVGPKLD